METTVIAFDLYAIYDRLMDGVVIPVTIAYDPDSIAANGFTDSNLYVEDVGWGEAQAFLEGYPFDLKRIHLDVLNHLTGESLEEVFVENIDDEVYDKIKHVYEGPED